MVAMPVPRRRWDQSREVVDEFQRPQREYGGTITPGFG